MPERTTHLIRPLLALIVIVAGGGLCVCGTVARAQADPPAGSEKAREVLDQARTLLEAGRLVRAQDALRRFIVNRERLAPSPEQLDRAMDLVSSVRGAMRTADPLEISLQKADLAIERGDLREAQRQAAAVTRSSTAPAQTAARARSIMELIQRRQADLTPIMAQMIDQALSDFRQGRYAAAKSEIEAIDRTGIRLDATENQRVRSCAQRISELELARGRFFEADEPLAGVFQPGLVHRRDEKKEADDARPEGEPAQQPPAEKAEPGQGEQPPAEEAEPEQGEQPPAEDPITRAMRLDAQRILAEADRAYEEARYAEAERKYARLLDEFGTFLSSDQTQHVEDRRTEARIRLRAEGQDLGKITQDRLLAKQQATVEVDNDLSSAREALATGDTTRARELAAKAGLTMNRAREFFSEDEFKAATDEINGLMAQIETETERILQQRLKDQEAEIQRQAKQREAQMAEDLQRRINEHLTRARALQREMKYREALEVVNQVLFLDPINPAGLVLRDLLADIIIYFEYNKIDRDRQVSYGMTSIENMRATIAPRHVMDFPPDWPALSIQRGQPIAFAEPAENRRVLAKIDSTRISAPFSDNTLGDALGYIQTMADVSMDVDWSSLGQIGITPDSRVSFNLTRELPVRTVLDRVLSKVSTDPLSRADWAVTDGILTIASDEMLRRNKVLQIYDIRDLLIEVPDYDDVPDIDLQSVLDKSRGVAGGASRGPFEQADVNGTEERLTTDEKVDRIRTLIEELVDPEGWMDNGGETGTMQELNGSLIITNTPKNHRAISGLLGQLRDIRSMQINVETRFLLVNQDFFEQIGFDLDVFINTNNNQVRAAQGVDPTIQGGDFFNFNSSRLSFGQQQAGLVRNVTGQAPVGGVAGAPNPTTIGVVNPAPFSPIAFAQNSLGLASGLAPASGIAADVLAVAPALGIAGQFLDDIQVDFLVQATQADRRSVQLTAPRLTFTNGQTSNIFVATQVSFVSDLQPIVGESAVGFDPTVSVVSEGVTMLVQGTISADRRFVTLNIDSGVTRIDSFAQQAVTAVAGGQLVNSADTQSFIQLPTVTVTRVQTTVTVPDQGTVLLGGQRLVTEFEVETGVPVLSKIPVLNRFFTNRIESREEQTLLILVKPTVLIQNEEEERNFPGLLDSLRSGFGG